MSSLARIVGRDGSHRRRGLIAVGVAIAGLLVAPAAVLADNCSSLGDCWRTAAGAAGTAVGVGVAGGLFGGLFGGGGGEDDGDGDGAEPDGDNSDDDCT